MGKWFARMKPQVMSQVLRWMKIVWWFVLAWQDPKAMYTCLLGPHYSNANTFDDSYVQAFVLFHVNTPFCKTTTALLFTNQHDLVIDVVEK